MHKFNIFGGGGGGGVYIEGLKVRLWRKCLHNVVIEEGNTNTNTTTLLSKRKFKCGTIHDNDDNDDDDDDDDEYEYEYEYEYDNFIIQKEIQMWCHTFKTYKFSTSN